MNQQEYTRQTPRQLASAIAHLLDVEERAMTAGHGWLRRLAAAKAAEASVCLHNVAMDTLERTRVRRITKAESQYGRIS